MTSWGDLDRELEAWGRAGDTVTFWWRDDDAIAPTPELDRLLEQAAHAANRPMPLSIAVIPAGATAALALRLAHCPHVVVLQHGYAHANHAPIGSKKMELGPHRPPETVLGELDKGRRRLADLFGARALPALVPPWNRIDAAIIRRLPEIGIAGLSTFGPRLAPNAASGVRQANTHIDILDWHGTRGFIGEAAALDLVLRHLSQRRQRQVDPSEPTGLLTHHLVHDDAAWRFLTAFLPRTAGKAQVRWLAGADVFRHGPPSTP
jgi:hypothetical protein